jgi:hypothetical protein
MPVPPSSGRQDAASIKMNRPAHDRPEMTATTLRTPKTATERPAALEQPQEGAPEPTERVQEIRGGLLAEINVLLAGRPLDLGYCSMGTLARIRADLIRATQPAKALPW